MHAAPAQYGRRKLASAPPPEISISHPRATSEVIEYPGLRNLIWAYFWLLLLEGALRKWILPGLANPLLIIRDPVVLIIYLSALKNGIFPTNGFIIASFLLALGNSFAALFAGQENIYVTLYGLRTAFLHIPLIFIMPVALTREDVEKIGNWFMITAIPMAVLALLQFRASPNAWINNGVGGSEGSQLTVGFGKIRPPGTFSFTSGLALYISVVAAYLLSFRLKKWKLSSQISFGALIAVGIMTGVSGSRTVLVSICLITVAMGYACLRNGRFAAAGFRTVIVIAVVCLALLMRHEFRLGLEIHQDRLASGGGIEEGLIQRTIGGFLEPFQDIGNIPFFGAGIGLGTTAAGGLIDGQRSFALAEGEWLRVVRESGPILGFGYLIMRVAIVALLFIRANRALDEDNPVPLLLCGAVGPIMLNGQFGVCTILGFAVFGAGLCLAACSLTDDRAEAPPVRDEVDPEIDPQNLVRGRSIYAEKLHGR